MNTPIWSIEKLSDNVTIKIKEANSGILYYVPAGSIQYSKDINDLSNNSFILDGVTNSLLLKIDARTVTTPVYAGDIETFMVSLSTITASAGSGSAGGSTIFLTDTPVVLSGGKSLGKYTNGQTIPTAGKDIETIIKDIALEYIFPSFNTLTSTIFINYEVGQVLVSGIQTVNYTVNNAVNIKTPQPPNVGTPSSNISGSTFAINPFQLLSTGSFQINIPAGVTKLVPDNYTISLQGQGHDLSFFSTTKTIFWLQKVFFGQSSLVSLAASDILSLQSNQLKSSFSGTYSFPANGYKYFCYPASMGTATTFTDTSNGFPVAMFGTVGLVSVTNAYGVTENYRVHRTLNILGGTINITIS